MITDYQSLQDAISSYLIDENLDSQIPTFISLAESEFNRVIRHRQQEAKATSALDIDEDRVGLPGDFVELRSVVLKTNPRRFLQYFAPQALENVFHFEITGQPKAYTIYGNNILVRPAPDSNYVVEILYYRQIPRLSTTNTSNWLLTRNPDIYLYASLVQAQPFIIQDERIATWQGLLDRAYAQLKYETDRGQWNSSPMTPLTDFFTP